MNDLLSSVEISRRPDVVDRTLNYGLELLVSYGIEVRHLKEEGWIETPSATAAEQKPAQSIPAEKETAPSPQTEPKIIRLHKESSLSGTLVQTELFADEHSLEVKKSWADRKGEQKTVSAVKSKSPQEEEKLILTLKKVKQGEETEQVAVLVFNKDGQIQEQKSIIEGNSLSIEDQKAAAITYLAGEWNFPQEFVNGTTMADTDYVMKYTITHPDEPFVANMAFSAKGTVTV